MQSEIKVGQRFKFCSLANNASPERQAVVTSVRSNREEGLGPEVDFYLAYWVEACELSETQSPTTLVFERGTDGNVYLDGRIVTITVLTESSSAQEREIVHQTAVSFRPIPTSAAIHARRMRRSIA